MIVFVEIAKRKDDNIVGQERNGRGLWDLSQCLKENPWKAPPSRYCIALEINTRRSSERKEGVWTPSLRARWRGGQGRWGALVDRR